MMRLRFIIDILVQTPAVSGGLQSAWHDQRALTTTATHDARTTSLHLWQLTQILQLITDHAYKFGRSCNMV